MFAKAVLLSALAACVAAQSKVLFFTHVPNPITDGEAAAITFSTNDTESPITIILRQGQQGNLQTVMTLTEDAEDSVFIWTPPKSIPNGVDYALQISQANQTNYFGPFTIQGASPAAVSSAAANTSTSAVTTATTTIGSAASMGTGTTMHRNTTMSSPSLTATKKTTTTKATTKTTAGGGASSSAGAGSQGSSTSGAAGPDNTNAASSDFNGGSSLALAFGAVAAVFYLV
ncbi:uncharacterized protein LTR77_001393 [Saxophila tyrrhenica]|uniref:Yeast cell wall synthesis Kre9/Knh1-like N-terminal domain-containing protein n=1 Tax=Saxophila tyrrhenica TaxID=1690608 RepID=A0AAV9PKD0_9PEZI|nr:hypothetical protein LTR77_001393 [Saxophila tyrrhenica]